MRVGDDTAGATVVVVVFFWCVVLPAPVCACEWGCAGAVVVTVVAVPAFFLGGFECSPATISTAMSTATAATAASGPPSRRGRRLIECMTGSSTPVMKVRASDPFSSSKRTGSEGLGTGGGGTGGTMAWLGLSVSRTVDELDTRKALAGNAASLWPFSSLLSRPSAPAAVCVRSSSSVCSRW